MRDFRSFLAVALLGGSLLSGCVVRAQARLRPGVVVVDDEPPPPRREAHRHRAGYVWIQGYWDRVDGRWEWRDGRYERERSSQVYVDGRWERRGRQWHWVDGRWDSGGGQVRDHRTDRNEPRQFEDVPVRTAPEPNVRDHRSHRNDPPPSRPVEDVPVRVSRDYPTEAPPAPRAEDYGSPRAGYVWISGYYRWEAGGGYNWIPGHWERKKAGRSWRAGSWDRRGDRYIWVEGRWE